jgi:antitoxin VapB
LETIEIKNYKGEQAIRIPKALQINDEKVDLKKVGNTLYIIPFHNPWQNLVESTQSFTSDFMEDRDNSNQQKREYFD